MKTQFKIFEQKEEFIYSLCEKGSGWLYIWLNPGVLLFRQPVCHVGSVSMSCSAPPPPIVLWTGPRRKEYFVTVARVPGLAVNLSGSHAFSRKWSSISSTQAMWTEWRSTTSQVKLGADQATKKQAIVLFFTVMLQREKDVLILENFLMQIIQ